MPSLRGHRVIGFTLVWTAASWGLPTLALGDGHDRNHCGRDRDIRTRALGLLSRVGPGNAAADRFKRDQQGAQCLIADKSTVYNRSSRMAEHTFSSSHTSKTEYSVKVSGGFKQAFSAEMGYRSENSTTETYSTTVELPPNTGARLSTVTSVWTVTGTWTHGPFYRERKDYVEVYRPTGELVWLIRDP